MTANTQTISRHVVSEAYPILRDFDRQAAEVLRSFNTWAFKRQQPTEPAMLEQTVALRIWQGKPISFVLYWGKGPRATAASPDLTCLDYLASMGARIGSAYAPGAQFHLCLTDTHAKLNGHSESAIASYFGNIARAASDRGMSCARLGQIVSTAPPCLLPQPAPDEAMLTLLERSAARWYRGGADVREGARTYLAMNHVESAAVATHYKGCIFLTFNGRDHRALFPASMPVFYMYSLRRGTAVKPWFMDESALPYDDAEGRRGKPLA